MIDESQRGFATEKTHPLVSYKAIRLFKNHLGLKFHYSLHEDIGPSLLEKGIGCSQASIPIYHYGFSLQQKAEERKIRNLTCILEAAKANPTAGNLFDLGRTYFLFDFYDEAIFVTKKAIEKRCWDYKKAT